MSDEYILTRQEIESLILSGDAGFPDRGTTDQQKEYLRERISKYRPAAPAPDDVRERFERWWYASKYCQVPGYPEKEWQQIAWDGWQAAMKEKP